MVLGKSPTHTPLSHFVVLDGGWAGHRSLGIPSWWRRRSNWASPSVQAERQVLGVGAESEGWCTAPAAPWSLLCGCSLLALEILSFHKMWEPGDGSHPLACTPGAVYCVMRALFLSQAGSSAFSCCFSLSVKLTVVSSWLSRLLFSIDQQLTISELHTVLGSLLSACTRISGPLQLLHAYTPWRDEQHQELSPSSCSKFSWCVGNEPNRPALVHCKVSMRYAEHEARGLLVVMAILDFYGASGQFQGVLIFWTFKMLFVCVFLFPC